MARRWPNVSMWVLGLSATLIACKKPPPNPSDHHEPLAVCPEPSHCKDGKNALICAKGALTPVPCRGPERCMQQGQAIVCDNTLAITGDPCDEEHDFACAVDRKAALECQSGKFAVVSSYDGIQGCTVKDGEISCEAGIPQPCDEIEDIACCLTFARRPRVQRARP